MKTCRASGNRWSKLPRWWLVAIGLPVAAVVLGMLFRSQHAGSDPNDVLRGAIVAGIEGNIARLSSAVLVWRSENRGLGPWSSKPERAGEHQLWWDGRRTAISYTMRSTTSDPNGRVSSDLCTRFMTYDGKEFRWAELPATAGGTAEMAIQNKPQYRPGENYLTDVGWLGRGLISIVWDKSQITEPGTLRYSQQGKLIEAEFRNSRTGGGGIDTYDGEKAYGLVARESFFQQGKIQSRTTIEYARVPGGAWFPVRVVTEGYSIQTGELLHRLKMEVDVGRSVFNDPAALPEGVFELKVGPNTEIHDLTSLTTKVKTLIDDL